MNHIKTALTRSARQEPAPMRVGDITSKLAAAALSSSSPLLSSIVLAPYGVLGTAMTKTGMAEVTGPPAGSVAFVDPARLHYIQSGPSGAGGAAGAIYAYLRIDGDEAFPPAVVEAVTAPTEAKHHAYPAGDDVIVHCIHVVGPDFRSPTFGKGKPREHAVATLAAAYENVLAEFDASGCQTLRLLPISGGIFAGRWRGEVAELTRDALALACVRVAPDVATRLASERRIELCIFMEQEMASFVKVGFEPHARKA